MLAPLECVAGKLQRPRRRSAQWACADGWYIRAGRRTHVPTFFLFWRHGCSASAKFACLQRQKPAMFAQMPLFVYRHFTGAVCTTSSDGRFTLFSAASTAAFSVASNLSKSSDILLAELFSAAPTASVACWAHQVQSFDLDQKVLVPGGFEEQIFGADEPRTGGKATKKHSALRDASGAERAEFYFDPLCQLAPAFNG